MADITKAALDDAYEAGYMACGKTLEKIFREKRDFTTADNIQNLMVTRLILKGEE